MRNMSSWSGRRGLWVALVGVSLVSVAAVQADAAKHRRPAPVDLGPLGSRQPRHGRIGAGRDQPAALRRARSQGHARPPERHRGFRDPPGRPLRGSRNRAQRWGETCSQATLHSGWAARITLTNHPSGGPVFSGPQLEPWICEAGRSRQAVRSGAELHLRVHVDQPAKSGFQPYNPSQPAVRRRADDDGPGRQGAVHRADRDRLHGSRPVPDLRPVPARQAVERRSRPSPSSTTSC